MSARAHGHGQHGHGRGGSRRSNRRKPPTTPLKAKIIGGVVAVLLAVPTVIVSLAMSHGTDESDTSAADFASTSQAAATVAAEQRLIDGDTAGAKQLAGQALAVSPISAPALRVLGLAEQKDGNYKAAGALMSESAALGWRDGPSQLWLAAAMIQNKDYANAANRLDATLRVNPFMPQLYDLVDSSVREPLLARQIVDRLALNPDWRTPYLTDQNQVGPDAARGRAAILTGLMHTSSPPQRPEMLWTAKRLQKSGAPADARSFWFTVNGIRPGNLYDGGFQSIQQTIRKSLTIPYEWMVNPIQGITVGSEPRAGVRGMALHVNSDGSTSGIPIQQILELGAGTYRLSVNAQGSSAALGAYSWIVRCTLDTGKTVLVSLPAATAAAGAPFSVVPSCPQQIVELHIQSGVKSPEAWFSNASIQ